MSLVAFQPSERALSLSQLAPALVLAGLLAVVFLATPVFPFVDYYAHIGRYHILAQFLDEAPPALAASYEPAWRLLPNLGLDILGTGLTLVFDPLVVAKLIVALVVGTLYTGILYLGFALHGRIPVLSALLAGIIAFHHILAWGFMNFCFGLGLMVWGLGLWIANDMRPLRQIAIALPFGVLLLFVHGVAFALWGLMLGMIELARLREERRLFTSALPVRMGRLLLLAIVPAGLFLQMPTAEAPEGVTAAFDNLSAHAAEGNFWPRIHQEVLSRLDSVLRVTESRFLVADYVTNALIWGGLLLGLATGRLRLHPRLWGAAGLALLLVPLMPPNLFGVGHIDDRIPVLLLVLLAAGLRINAGPELHRAILVAVATALLVRTALVGAGWITTGQVYRDYLDTIDTLALEGPATLVMSEEARDRNTLLTRCEPLLPLLLIRGNVAVPTFANPTEQPLRIVGPLAETRNRDVETLQAMQDAPDDLAALALQGFNTIIICGTDTPETALSAPIARGASWAIFTPGLD
jgi:hypothetical protein